MHYKELIIFNYWLWLQPWNRTYHGLAFIFATPDIFHYVKVPYQIIRR